MSKFTGTCSDDILRAAEVLHSATRVLIGVGSGLSAAGGLNYLDPALVQRWYPEYWARGMQTLMDIQSHHWSLSMCSEERYWGYWARHIWHIRYEPDALKPYRDLRGIIGKKQYFICSTNVDGQLAKAGFDKEYIFAPQGDYALLQCEVPCSYELYDNQDMVDAMIKNMPAPDMIRLQDVPRCPKCSAHLIPNLRCDHRFVEEAHLWNMAEYERFIAESHEQGLVLLEMGVGFNTPGIIRFPFEDITKALPDATLIRINNSDITTHVDLGDRVIGIKHCLGEALDTLALNR